MRLRPLRDAGTRPLRKSRKERGTPRVNFGRVSSGPVAETTPGLSQRTREGPGHPLLGAVKARFHPLGYVSSALT